MEALIKILQKSFKPLNCGAYCQSTKKGYKPTNKQTTHNNDDRLNKQEEKYDIRGLKLLKQDTSCLLRCTYIRMYEVRS